MMTTHLHKEELMISEGSEGLPKYEGTDGY